MADDPVVPPVNPQSPPPPPPPPAAWYQGFEAEEVGYIQNRGWDKLDPAAAFREAAKAHRAAEKHIGVPADKLVRLPNGPADAEGLKTFYEKIGVPADDKGYDFSGIKFADGTELDAGFTTEMAKVLRSAGVAKDKAPEIVKAIVALGEQEDASSVAAREATLAAQRDALKIDWGSNVEKNLIIARGAAKQLGVDPEAVAALEGQVGYAAVMKMFHRLGAALGEHQFFDVGQGSGGGNKSGTFTVEQARAELARLEGDTAWVAKINAGDATAMQQFDNLTRIIASAVRH